MNKILNVTLNDLRIQFSDSSIWLNLFILPIVFIFIIGAVNGAFAGGGGESATFIDVIDNDNTALSAEFLAGVRDLDSSFILCPIDNTEGDICGLGDAELTEDLADQRIIDADTRALLIIPQGFEEAALNGQSIELVYRSEDDPLQPSTLLQEVQTVVQRFGGASLAATVGADIYESLGVEDGDTAAFREAVYASASLTWSSVGDTVRYRLTSENAAEISVEASTVDVTYTSATRNIQIVDLIDLDGTPTVDNFVDVIDGVRRVVCPVGNTESDICGLDGAEVTPELAQARLEAGETSGIITIPAGFEAAIIDGGAITLDVAQADNVDVAGLAEIAATVVEPSDDVPDNAGFAQSVPGMGTMYVMFTVLAGANLLLQERKTWTLQRLVTMPISRMQLFAGKMLGRFSMGMIQYFVAFAFGLSLGVDFGNSPLGVFLLMGSFALCMAAITMLLATLVETEQQAAGIATFFVLTTAPLGGAWWPLEIVPDFMQTLALFTPIGWAMRGFNELAFYGGTLTDILPSVGVLLAATAVIFSVSVMRYEYE
jgi:ABC-type multidrug transport system permease subunit